MEVCGLGDWGLGDGGRVCRCVCVCVVCACLCVRGEVLLHEIY